MEADAALAAYEDLHRMPNGTITIGHIIADDDSSMRSLLKHPTMYHRKGALPEDLPEPEWLADPTHRTKVMAKPFYALAGLGKNESECTNVDATRIKIWWGYMIKYYRDHPIEEVRRAAKSILEHLFDDHTYCDPKWCKPLRDAQTKQKTNDSPSFEGGFASRPPAHANPPYPTSTVADSPALSSLASDAAGPGRRASPPPLPTRPPPPATSDAPATTDAPASSDANSDPAISDANPPSPQAAPENEKREKGYYRCKVRHRKLYEQMKQIWDRLTTDERLKECMHLFDSQINEALNTAVGKYARKGRTYCTTMSLTNRVMIAMGVHNLGYLKFWYRVFDALKLHMSPALRHHLQQKDSKKTKKRKYESSPERKRKRMKGTHEKMRKELEKQIKDYNRGATYGSGIAILSENRLPQFVIDDDRNMKKLKSQRCPLPGCMGRNHTTSSSKNCKYYGCSNQEEMDEKMKNHLMSKYPDQYGKYTK